MFDGFVNDAVPLAPFRLQLLADGADCAHCPLSRNGQPGRPVPTEWSGRGSPSVAVVGEAPGRREVQTGRPFVGPSGKLLNYACARGGIARGEIAILNAAACGPIPSGADGIKAAATMACRPRLLKELTRLQPKVIMAVGSYALKVLAAPNLGGGITVNRGALLPLAQDVSATVGASQREGSPVHSQGGIKAAAPTGGIGLDGGPFFMSTFHPAHILRGGDGEQDVPGGDATPAVDLLFYFFLYDLVKAHRLAHGLAAPWADDLDLFVTRGGVLRRAFGDPCNHTELTQAMDRVYSEAKVHRAHACDVETDSKDSLAANLTAIGFATVDGGTSATWNAWQLVPQALRIARALLQDKSIYVDFHNRIYDTCVLPRHGLPVLAPVGDTLLSHHAAFPGLPHKLDQVATQFFITVPWKAEFRKGEKDEESLVLYNGRDALCTARLRPPLNKMLETHKVQRVYEADRQQFSVATRMRQVGYFVDQVERKRQSDIQHARLDAMQVQLLTDFKAIEETWRQALARILAQKQRKKDPESYLDRVKLRYEGIAKREQKPTDIGYFKPKAKKDLVALFEVLRIPITDYTPKGAPITDKKAMENASGRHPLMRRLIHLRGAQHLLATYIDGLPVKADGRVHPDWSPKITGRWGAGKAQNWPKFVDGWPPEVNADGSWKVRPSGDYVCTKENPRRIVTAPTAREVLSIPVAVVDPIVRMRAMYGHGRILVGADFSQVELRIAGYLSRDSFLLDIFRRGVDPHGAFARECFESFPQIETDFYKIAKLYGSDISPKKDLDKLKVDFDPAHKAELKKLGALWSRLRDLTKRAEYCGIYGGSADVVYESIVKDFPEVTLRALQLLIDKINKQMEGVVRWRNEQEAYARINREIREQLLGRVRLFPLGNFNPNIVYNFPIQAFAASLLCFAILRFTALTHPELLQFEPLYRMGLLDARWVSEMRERGFSEWRAPVDLILNGHDSLLAETDEEDGDKAVEFVGLAMEQTLPMDGETMLIPAEAAKGRRWSDT